MAITNFAHFISVDQSHCCQKKALTGLVIYAFVILGWDWTSIIKGSYMEITYQIFVKYI